MTPDLLQERFPLNRLAWPLSALLHVGLILLLLNDEFVWGKLSPVVPREVAVELVPEPSKPLPAKVEPPKSVRPSVEPAPVPAMVAGATPLPPPELPRPLPPQLAPAPLAAHSSAPSHVSSPAEPSHGAAPAVLSLAGKDAEKTRPATSNGPERGTLTQSEQDFILSQIMKYWHVDFHSPEGHGLVLRAIILVQADGTLASPMNKNDRWNPAEAIEGYETLVRRGYSYQREALEGFLLALRLCQPLKLPPGETWPKQMVLRFAFDDL